MPFTKGTVPKRLKGKGIPQKFVDQFIAVFNKVTKDGGDEAAAYRQAFAVLTTALRKEGYRQGKDGDWHKTSRKEELEPEVLSFPSGGIVLEENQSLEQALATGLTYEGMALVDFAISQQGSWQPRYYSPAYNDKAMIATNEYMERGYPVTSYNKHDSVNSSENPIGKIIAPLWREGDEIRYKARISPTERGKEAMILIFDEVMQPTSVRQYECKSVLRRILGNEDDDNDQKGEDRWVLELLEGRIGGIDFCDQPGINGAGLKRLEGMPEFSPDQEIDTDTEPYTEDDMDWKDITLDELRENRPDLLDAYTVAGLETFAAANVAMQTKITALEAREDPPDLTAENESLRTGLVATQEKLEATFHQLHIEQAAHTVIGRAIAAKLREANVTAENMAQQAEALRDEAIQAAMAAYKPGESAPKGQSFPKDADSTPSRSPFPETLVRPTAEMNEMAALMHNTR